MFTKIFYTHLHLFSITSDTLCNFHTRRFFCSTNVSLSITMHLANIKSTPADSPMYVLFRLFSGSSWSRANSPLHEIGGLCRTSPGADG